MRPHLKSAPLVVISGCMMMFLTQCGLSTGGPSTGSDADLDETPGAWVNPKPVVDAVMVQSAQGLAVGEPVYIRGSQFIETAHGHLFVRFKGEYRDDRGVVHPVDLTERGKLDGSGFVRWSMWPNIVFHPTGDRLGTFTGTVTVTNQAFGGDKKSSDPRTTTIRVRPSLIASVVQPLATGCAAQVRDTLEDTRMRFVVEAIGLQRGTPDKPLKFSWGFLGDQWAVEFDNGVIDPYAKQGGNAAYLLQDTVEDGASSTLESGRNRSFVIKAMQDLLGTGGLKKLATKTVTKDANDYLANVMVAAQDANGKKATLTIPVTVHKAAGMEYDGYERIIERMSPQMKSDCMNGGMTGREVTVHNTESQSFRKQYSFNAHGSVGGNFNLQKFITMGVNVNVGFGVSNAEFATADSSQGLSYSSHLLPSMYGVFYFQPSKVERVAQAFMYNVCGQKSNIGTISLHTYTFAWELAQGDECTPPSKLTTCKQGTATPCY